MSISDVDAPNDLLLITDVSSTQSKTINLDNFGGAITASRAITSSFALKVANPVTTGSLLSTASVALNTVTFTKGDGTTFPITINTGSSGAFPFVGEASITGSLIVSGSGTNGKVNALNIEIDGTSSLRRENGANVLYVGNSTNWDEIEYGRTTSTSHKFNSSITGSDISASSMNLNEIYVADNIWHKDDSNTGIVFGSDSITSKVNNVDVIKGDITIGTTLGSLSQPTIISGSTIFIDNLTSANPSLQALTYDTSSGRIHFTPLIQTSTGSTVVIGDDDKEIDFKATDVKFIDNSNITKASINPQTGDAKFGVNSVTISGSGGTISGSGMFSSRRSYANLNNSTVIPSVNQPLTAVMSSSGVIYSNVSSFSKYPARFVMEHFNSSPGTSSFAGSGSAIHLSNTLRGGLYTSTVQLASITTGNNSSADFVVGASDPLGNINEKLKVSYDGVIYGERLRLTSGSNAWLNSDDTFSAALSSSNAVYSPIQAISPNPAVFITEHSSGPLTYAGSGSAIALVSSAKFANPSLSTKNATVQLTSVAAINNTHAADFTVGTRTASPANVTEKLRITHDGKTIVTGSFHVNNSGSFMTGSTVVLENLPTVEPTVSGSLWLSGSGAGSSSGSKYLMVFNG